MSNQRLEQTWQPDEEWLKQTKKNLHLIFEKISSIFNLHWRVKLEMISMLLALIETCSATLEVSLPLLIRKLIQLTVDENQEVQEKANQAVDHLSLSHVDFNSAVRQNLYDIVTGLPRIVTQGIDREQLKILEELRGHIVLLDSRLEQSLMFSGLRERLFKSLLMCASMKSAKVAEGDEPYSLVFLRDFSVIQSFITCCMSIGKNSELGDTSDFLLDVLRQKDTYSKESVYIMLYVIRGASPVMSVYLNIIQDYEVVLTALDVTNVDDIILGQLILRVVGELAKSAGSSFSSVLLNILRVVVEKAGHPDFHTAGVYALECITNAIGYSSISKLLESNIDYFAPQLTYQLRNITRYPNSIDLLRALLLLSEVSLENWLERMVQQALKGLDRAHSTKALPYVQVFELYCKAIHKLRKQQEPVMNVVPKNNDWSLQEVVRRISEHKSNIQTCETLLSEDNVDEPSESFPDDAEAFRENETSNESSIPSCIDLVKDILERCIQILPQTRDDRLYGATMQAITFSIKVLAPYENIFLPKAHQLWEPLKNQLLSSPHLKQRQAFDVFLLLVQSCPDFIRHRVITETFPNIINFLETLASSKHDRCNQAHLATQAYKFQKAILSSVATLIQFLDPSTTDVTKMIHATSLYLSNLQVPELQTIAKENLILVAKRHPGPVWLILSSLVPRTLLSVENLSPILVGRSDGDNEFSTNAEELVFKLFPLSHCNQVC